MKPEDIERYAAREYDRAASGIYRTELESMPFDVAGSTLLDLGAGPGTWSHIAAQSGASLVIWQDRSVEFARLARDHISTAGRVQMVLADLSSLPYRNDSFDICLCRLALYHSPDEAGTVREVARVLQPGGVFWVTTHTWERAVTLPNNWKKPVHVLAPGFNYLWSRVTGKSAKRLPTLFQTKFLVRRDLEAAGFEIEEWREAERGTLSVVAILRPGRVDHSGESG